jgi:hypothetical protein
VYQGGSESFGVRAAADRHAFVRDTDKDKAGLLTIMLTGCKHFQLPMVQRCTDTAYPTDALARFSVKKHATADHLLNSTPLAQVVYSRQPIASNRKSIISS